MFRRFHGPLFTEEKRYRGPFKNIRETGEEVTLVGVKYYPRRPRARVGDNGNEGERERREIEWKIARNLSLSPALPSALLYLITYHNIVRDKLLLDLGAKFRP